MECLYVLTNMSPEVVAEVDNERRSRSISLWASHGSQVAKPLPKRGRHERCDRGKRFGGEGHPDAVQAQTERCSPDRHFAT